MKLAPKPARSMVLVLAIAGTACGRSMAPAYHGAVSDHFDGERFFNYERTPEHQLEDAIRLKEPGRHLGHWDDWQQTPTDTPPARVLGSDLRVTFVNRSTVLVQTDSVNILIDPVWSERAIPQQTPIDGSVRRGYRPGAAGVSPPSGSSGPGVSWASAASPFS